MGKYLYIAPFENNMVIMPEDLDLTYLTGEMVERTQRDVIYEEREVLGEEGNVIGTETVFAGWGDEYIETIEERKGGMSLITPHYQGQDIQSLVLVHTSLETKAILDEEWVYLSELEEADVEI